jgi:hypothetical protein
MKIEVSMDQVEIEGQVVKRPTALDRGFWMAFWERLRNEESTTTCWRRDCPIR